MARSTTNPFALERDVSRSVLVVEHDPHVRDLQAHFLGRAGFAVEFCDDGLTALDRARVMNPTLIVTEILVPKLDGLTLCTRLREDPLTAHIPVMVFSILSAGTRAAEAGARAFVRKPLIESSFLSAVEDVIAAHGSQEQK
jgi:CheY-like chemotaxis protein